MSQEKIFFEERNYDYIQTGFQSLDETITGFGKGELIFIGGAGGPGVSYDFIINLAYNISKQFYEECTENVLRKKSVGFFSLLKPKYVLCQQILSIIKGIPFTLNKDNHSNEYFEFGVRYTKFEGKNFCFYLDLYIEDTPTLTINSIRERIKQMVDIHNTRVVFIDCLELIQREKSFEYKIEEISNIIVELKRMAREFNISIVVLSELSVRDLLLKENTAPTLKDIKYHNVLSIADIIMFVYYHYYFLSQRAPFLNASIEQKESWKSKMNTFVSLVDIDVDKSREEKELYGSLLCYERTIHRFKDYMTED
ncbi:hypothetical protein J5751_05050 [bacterium]|nr:hypothetical protein [bacterium]